jgi:hypothetical protein
VRVEDIRAGPSDGLTPVEGDGKGEIARLAQDHVLLPRRAGEENVTAGS